MLSKPTQQHDGVLTTKEAANYLGLHRKTLLQDAKDGLIPYYRRSNKERGRIRFRLSDLNNYLDTQRVDRRRKKAATDDIDWGAI